MERFDLQSRYHAWFEHWHRYHWVKPLIENKLVGDFACGEGYGSALLAQSARQVFAADLNQETILKAGETYQQENLSYLHANVCELPLEDDSLDVVVSFETLEHLLEHEALINEFKRVLKPEGLLIMSTPDKDIYSGDTDHNEFHLKELTAEEFRALISEHFQHNHWYGQRLETGSSISPLQAQSSQDRVTLCQTNSPDQTETIHPSGQHTYLIALASESENTMAALELPGFGQFNSSENQLFEHQENQIKRLLEADQYIQKLEAEIQQQQVIMNHLKARLGL